MRLFHRIRNNSLTAFTIAVAALIVWVAAELVVTPKKTSTQRTAGRIRQLPPPPDGPLGPTELQPRRAAASASDSGRPSPGPSFNQGTPVPVSVLTKLRPGMTRAEVERVLGAPAADKILPLSVDEGRLTYRTAYELSDLDGPNTVRPIPRRPLPPVAGRTAPPSVVALEFDASRPGHPLVEVLYPDPLF